MNIAILGTGKIGCDLLAKVIKSKNLNCILFSGRRESSPGIEFAKSHNIDTCNTGIEGVLNSRDTIELVFDATSASAHQNHALELRKHGVRCINLTPAQQGKFCIPAIDNSDDSKTDISLITCGGQASIPMIHAIIKAGSKVNYIETVTTIAAKSAGSATRNNISEYQYITQMGIRSYSQCDHVKSILVINPAEPPISMQTTIFMLGDNFNLQAINDAISLMLDKMKNYISGYEIITRPVMNHGRLVMIVKVTGCGDYLPTYAGNLDIITSSAIQVAERMSRVKVELK